MGKEKDSLVQCANCIIHRSMREDMEEEIERKKEQNADDTLETAAFYLVQDLK